MGYPQESEWNDFKKMPDYHKLQTDIKSSQYVLIISSNQVPVQFQAFGADSSFQNSVPELQHDTVYGEA